MLGTIANTLAIIAGSTIGLTFRKIIAGKKSDALLHAIAFVVILIGIKGAWKTDDFLILLCCMALGTFIGVLLGIEEGLNRFGRWLGGRFTKSKGDISKGFVTTTLLYCVGSMAIVGSLESGLAGKHDILFAKSVLDGLASIVFSATLGIGVIFSAGSVFLYQGTITITASFMKQFLTTEVITQMSAVGGLIIVAMGFNMLNITKIKVGNILPAIFLPLVYYMIKKLLSLIY
ncbi:MAG: DUF554 domain-containing protein [Desulfobacteraceae bacterium]|jgi:hypothetical protein